MARVALALILALSVFSSTSSGYEFRPAKDYVSRILQKASRFVVMQDEPVTPTEHQSGPDDCQDGLFPNPESCDSYVTCVNGAYFTLLCANDEHFNPDTRRCENPCSARCDQNLTCICGWDTCQTTELPTEEVSEEPTETSRRRFKNKFLLSATKVSTDLPTEEATEEASEEPTEEPTEEASEEPTEEPTETSRRRFKKKFLLSASKISTDFPTEEASEEQTEEPTETSRRRFKKKFLLSATKVSTDLSTEEPTEELTDEPTDYMKIFRPLDCDIDGLYPHPFHCTKYIKCSNGEFYVMLCPSKLHFNRYSKRCESLCDARCDIFSEILCGFNLTSSDEGGWEDTTTLDTTFTDDNVCRLPPFKGPCDAYMTRYYYSTSERRCKKFIFGGCRSNGNNFRTKEECTKRCLPYAHTLKKSVSSFTCTQDGLYPNSEDCGTYIQCSNGQDYVMPCPEGLQFSQETNRCESPCDAHCDPSIADICSWDTNEYSAVKPGYDFTCIKDGLYTNPDDCATYIQCSNGQSYIMPCPKDLHFSEDTKRCESSCDAHCDPSIAEECGWDERAYSLKQPFYDFTCIKDGLFTNPEDCTTYIQCSNGQSYIMPCPKDLHFSQETQRCESPCDAHCDPSIADECEWDKKVYSLRQPFFDSLCIKDELYANSEDCTTYFQCSNGQSYVMPCPKGLHFSKKTNRCESPCDAYCDISLFEECGWDSRTTTERSPINPTEDAWSYDTEVPTEYSRISYDFTCIKNGLYQNPENCEGYIQCSNGQAYEMPCPSGLHFSFETQRCESPCDAHCNPNLACDCEWPECIAEEIDCEAEPEVGSCKAHMPRYYYDRERGKCRFFYYGGCEGNSNNFVTERECAEKCQQKLLGGFRCPSYTGRFGHYPDCMSYYDCKRGIPTLKRCAKGTAFDHKKSKCVTEYEAKCIYECRDPDAVYPIKHDCRRYIDCVNGISKVEKCPPGLAFDPDRRDCVDARTVSCPGIEGTKSMMNLKVPNPLF